MNSAFFDDDLDPMVRPSLDESITALFLVDKRFPWLTPTDEEADATEAIRHVAATHRGSTRRCVNPNEPRHYNRIWGTCTACHEPWPCTTWNDVHTLAVEFVGRAHNRYAAHARDAITRLSARPAEEEESA